jgi:hypothetical protein
MPLSTPAPATGFGRWPPTVADLQLRNPTVRPGRSLPYCWSAAGGSIRCCSRWRWWAICAASLRSGRPPVTARWTECVCLRFLDAASPQARVSRRVIFQAAVFNNGVAADGHRGLGFVVGDGGDAPGSTFLRSLKPGG